MTSENKILFITWDGPQTSYLEGLFLPIFETVSKKEPCEFHVLQFTWSDNAKTNIIKKKAEAMGIFYTPVSIIRKPNVIFGSVLTIWKGISIIDAYIKKYQINIVMPRSTFPAMMVNRISNKEVKVIFDADGLPLEERVDFSGLSSKSFQYRFLKKEEKKLLKNANVILTRSRKSIDIHIKAIGKNYRQKFVVVLNGRDTNFFKPNPIEREKIRENLGIKKNDRVFVYCGSLGPQYGWEEMISLFSRYNYQNPNSKFLIITGSPEFAVERMPNEIKANCIIKSLPFQEVPQYLNCADIAFAIRKPTFSMQGVAPIKLGEYLLMGLPTIASRGIGDTEFLLNQISNCFLYDHENEVESLNSCLMWLKDKLSVSSLTIRERAILYFSLEAAAESYLQSLQKLN